MAGSRISTTVTDTVLLGGALYPSPLSITATGIIDPATFGATGVLADAASAELLNRGHITGGAGSIIGGDGGIGVDLTSGGDHLSNNGTITGGDASAYVASGGAPGKGGDGVDITSGTIGNAGSITGGAGGFASAFPNGYTPNNGGAGVFLQSSSLFNSGTITGGLGGNVGYNDDGGGAGVTMAGPGSTLRNMGRITGGAGQEAGSFGGVGVNVANDTLVNFGTITGGVGGTFLYGGAGVDVAAGGLVINHGTIVGGGGSTNGDGGGGPGVVINGGTLINYGSIDSGYTTGNYSYLGSPGIQFGPQGGTLTMEPGSYVVNVGGDPAGPDTTLRFAGHDGTLHAGSTVDFTDAFSNVIVDNDSNWEFLANEYLARGGALHDLGTLTVAYGYELSVDDPRSATGDPGAAVFIGPDATLAINGNLGVDSVHFAAGGGTLSLGTMATFRPNHNDPLSVSTLTNFGAGDVIHLAQIATSLSFSDGTLKLDNGTTVLKRLTLAGDYTTKNFHLAADKAGGTDITYVPTTPALHAPSHPESSTGLMAWFHTHIT